MTTPPAPSPALTPYEAAHYQSVAGLYGLLDSVSRSPDTTPELRELLEPEIVTVWNEMTEMNAIALSRGTVNLKAEAKELQPALDSVKQLKAELDGYARKTQDVLTIVARVDTVLSTAKQLGIDV